MLAVVPRSRSSSVLVLAAAALAVGAPPGCYRTHRRAPLDAGADAPDDAGSDPPDAPSAPACMHRLVREAQLTSFTDHGARSPDLVRTPAGLSTVFLESDGDVGHPFVSLVFTSDELGGATPPLLVGEESHSWAEALALEDGSVAIGWLSDPGLVSRTALRRIDARGRPFGDRVDVDFEGATCVDLAPAGPLVAVAYRGTLDEAPVAWLVFVDPVAGGLRSARMLLGPDGVSPQLGALGDDRVVAVLPDATGVSLRTFAPSGPVGGSLRVPSDRPVGRTAIAVRDDTIALAMQVGDTGARGLRLVLVDAGLERPGPPVELVPEGLGVLGVRVVATPLGYTVSWTETTGDLGEGRFLVAHLGPDGVPREPRRVVFAGQLGSFAGPGLASSGERSWVATSRPIEGRGHAQLFLAAYACAPRRGCDALEAAPAPGACDEPRVLGVAWDGTRCARVLGCAGCEGPDCDALAATEAECVIDHAACPGGG